MTPLITGAPSGGQSEGSVARPARSPDASQFFAPANAAVRRAAVWCLCALAAIGYLVQCFTPLRMTEDSVIYLSVAHSVAEGKGFLYRGVPITWFPPGYPALISLLKVAGLGNSFYINLLNLLAGGAGLLAVRSIARSRDLQRGRLCIVYLAFVYSFIVIKDAAMPLSDLVFFGVTLTAIAVAESAARLRGRHAWIRWACSLSLAVASVSVRWVGFAVVTALLFECWRAALRGPRTARLTAAILLGLAALITAAGFLKWAANPGSLAMLVFQVYKNKPPGEIVTSHLPDLGQLVLNVPQSKLPERVRGVMYPAGFVLLAFVGLSLVRSRHAWSPGKTFALCYSLMIFCAPYTPGAGSEPRYWLPVFPLFIMEIISGENLFSALASRRVGFAAHTYAVYFLAAGIGALGYSDLMSVSRKVFLDANIISRYQPAYRAWLLHLPPDSESDTDPRILPILREYGGKK